MSQDIYKDVEQFAVELDAKGHSQFAKDIRNAVASGSIGSEILGLVSLELNRAKKVLPASEEHLIKTANQLYIRINTILSFS